MRDEIGYGHDPDFVVHAIRHTFASRLAEKGASLYDVSKLLGHSTITTTEKYAHLFNEQLVKTVRLLDADSQREQSHVIKKKNRSPTILIRRKAQIKS